MANDKPYWDEDSPDPRSYKSDVMKKAFQNYTAEDVPEDRDPEGLRLWGVDSGQAVMESPALLARRAGGRENELLTEAASGAKDPSLQGDQILRRQTAADPAGDIRRAERVSEVPTFEDQDEEFVMEDGLGAANAQRADAAKKAIAAERGEATFDLSQPQAWKGAGEYSYSYTPGDQGSAGTIQVTHPDGRVANVDQSSGRVWSAIMAEHADPENYDPADYGGVVASGEAKPEAPADGAWVPGQDFDATMGAGEYVPGQDFDATMGAGEDYVPGQAFDATMGAGPEPEEGDATAYPPGTPEPQNFDATQGATGQWASMAQERTPVSGMVADAARGAKQALARPGSAADQTDLATKKAAVRNLRAGALEEPRYAQHKAMAEQWAQEDWANVPAEEPSEPTPVEAPPHTFDRRRAPEAPPPEPSMWARPGSAADQREMAAEKTAARNAKYLEDNPEAPPPEAPPPEPSMWARPGSAADQREMAAEKTAARNAKYLEDNPEAPPPETVPANQAEVLGGREARARAAAKVMEMVRIAEASPEAASKVMEMVRIAEAPVTPRQGQVLSSGDVDTIEAPAPVTPRQGQVLSSGDVDTITKPGEDVLDVPPGHSEEEWAARKLKASPENQEWAASQAASEEAKQADLAFSASGGGYVSQSQPPEPSYEQSQPPEPSYEQSEQTPRETASQSPPSTPQLEDDSTFQAWERRAYEHAQTAPSGKSPPSTTQLEEEVSPTGWERRAYEHSQAARKAMAKDQGPLPTPVLLQAIQQLDADDGTGNVEDHGPLDQATLQQAIQQFKADPAQLRVFRARLDQS